MKKKNITKKPPTRVHAFRCTDEVWSQLKTLAKECGISLNRYLTETGLKHHPRQRLTKEEVEALNSLVSSEAHQRRSRGLELTCLCKDGSDKNHQRPLQENGRGKVETLQDREVHDMVDEVCRRTHPTLV